MLECGIIGDRFNLTSETSLIRASYILSKFGRDNFKENWNKNLEGFEIKNLDVE